MAKMSDHCVRHSGVELRMIPIAILFARAIRKEASLLEGAAETCRRSSVPVGACMGEFSRSGERV